MAQSTRTRLLERIVADAERRLDGQVAAARHSDSTAGHFLAVGVAMLGFGISLALYAFQQGPLGTASILAFGVSLVQNLFGIGLLVESFAAFGRHSDLLAAPDAGWLEDRMADPDWDLQSHLSSLVSSYVTYAAENNLARQKSAQARRSGMILLASAAICYLASTIFILGGTISG